MIPNRVFAQAGAVFTGCVGCLPCHEVAQLPDILREAVPQIDAVPRRYLHPSGRIQCQVPDAGIKAVPEHLDRAAPAERAAPIPLLSRAFYNAVLPIGDPATEILSAVVVAVHAATQSVILHPLANLDRSGREDAVIRNNHQERDLLAQDCIQ